MIDEYRVGAVCLVYGVTCAIKLVLITTPSYVSIGVAMM